MSRAYLSKGPGDVRNRTQSRPPSGLFTHVLRTAEFASHSKAKWLRTEMLACWLDASAPTRSLWSLLDGGS
jgi:hypothetical protein